MGPCQNFLTLVGSAIFGLGLEIKFPLKFQKISIFALQVKKNLIRSGQKVPGSTPYLLWVKSMLRSGQCPFLEFKSLDYDDEVLTEIW